MHTLVIQSYKSQETPEWIAICLASVESWSTQHGYDYRFIGDEIFDRVPDWYRVKTLDHPQIATDLGRLHLIQEAFDEGYDRAVWLDADVLVTDPEKLAIDLTTGFTLGREVWIQSDTSGVPGVYRNVHNAFLVFCRDNMFLTFYSYACERIIRRMEPGPNRGMAPQIVGPKLLTSLHNTLGFDLDSRIAMLSPEVLADIIGGGGQSLDLFRESLTDRVFGANLCASFVQEGTPKDNDFMESVCSILQEKPGILSPT